MITSPTVSFVAVTALATIGMAIGAVAFADRRNTAARLVFTGHLIIVVGYVLLGVTANLRLGSAMGGAGLVVGLYGFRMLFGGKRRPGLYALMAVVHGAAQFATRYLPDPELAEQIILTTLFVSTMAVTWPSVIRERTRVSPVAIATMQLFSILIVVFHLGRSMTGLVMGLEEILASDLFGLTSTLIVSATGAVALTLVFLIANASAESRVLTQTIAELESQRDFSQRLLQIVGHDLATPLMVIRTSLSAVMQSGDRNPEDRREYVELALRANDSAQNLMTDLTLWAKSLQGTLTLASDEIELGELAHAVVAQLLPVWTLKGVSVRCDTENEAAVVIGDPAAASTVLRNIVGNAIKYSNTGDAITIEITAVDGETRIVVTDCGMGMTEHRLAAVRSGQGIESILGTGSERGTGFGVELASTLCSSMGWNLEFDSAQNVGTTVTLTLPSDAGSPGWNQVARNPTTQ